MIVIDFLARINLYGNQPSLDIHQRNLFPCQAAAYNRTFFSLTASNPELLPKRTPYEQYYFSLGMVAFLTVLEVVHLIVLGTWNNEVFTVIAGLVGNITGIFLTQKA